MKLLIKKIFAVRYETSKQSRGFFLLRSSDGLHHQIGHFGDLMTTLLTNNTLSDGDCSRDHPDQSKTKR